MAKRANPFLDDFVQQSKVHVGVKQFNNNEGRLQKVYEKTLDLLFKGAKRSPQILSLNDGISPSGIQHKDRLKQMIISMDGTLAQSSVDMPAPDMIAKGCPCDSRTMVGSCAYCDTGLCSACCHTCSTCSELYCSKCTLLGPEGNDVCVSCYH